jgi:hypothetical protein
VDFSVPNSPAIYTLQPLEMLLLPFLAILMVAILGHVFGEETLPIDLLADFGTNILGSVKKYCHENPKEQTNPTLCKSEDVEEVEKKFLEFGKKVMQEKRMYLAKHKTAEGNSVS